MLISTAPTAQQFAGLVHLMPVRMFATSPLVPPGSGARITDHLVAFQCRVSFSPGRPLCPPVKPTAQQLLAAVQVIAKRSLRARGPVPSGLGNVTLTHFPPLQCRT